MSAQPAGSGPENTELDRTMAFQGGDQPDERHSSESSGKNSGLSQETARDGRRYGRIVPTNRSISPHSKVDDNDR